MNKTLASYQTYTDTLSDFAHHPCEELIGCLKNAERSASLLATMSVAAWDLPRGTVTTEDLTDHLYLVDAWRKGGNQSTEKLTIKARAALISFGSIGPLSDHLDRDEFSVFYDITRSGVNSIGDSDNNFTKFAIKAIGRNLLNEGHAICDGYKLGYLSRQEALSNIRFALNIVGRPNRLTSIFFL